MTRTAGGSYCYFIVNNNKKQYRSVSNFYIGSLYKFIAIIIHNYKPTASQIHKWWVSVDQYVFKS